MFCPKCGTKNPETGKFCRSCGGDLAIVSQALSGGLRDPISEALLGDDKHSQRIRRRTDPDEAWAAGVRQTITGFGFVVISLVLFFTNVAGGNAWWWAMLFPAFTFISTGISYLVRASRLEKRQAAMAGLAQNQIGTPQAGAQLPPAQAQFAMPTESIYKTGDLVPPSVVENTTRHLSIDNEGETMTLPNAKPRSK